MTTRTRWLAVVSASLVLAACRYRPALFADRPVVTMVEDDAPIPLPSSRDPAAATEVSDVYLRRPLFDVVHPVDFPTGGDVNAVDEVPPSSWYDPAGAPSDAAPPTLPLIALDEDPRTHADALVVRDAAGQRFELIGDRPGHPGLVTGADVIAGRLLRGLGLRTPPAWITAVPEAALGSDGAASSVRLRRFRDRQEASDGPRPPPMRLSATRWPEGIDVGVSGDFVARADDPNDKVLHRDRRTLRAMRVFAHWLGWSGFGTHATRDVYVGRPGAGHLVHYFVGTADTLGAGDAAPGAVVESDPGFLVNLVTLGLSPPRLPERAPSAFASLGPLSARIDPETFDVTPPYSPFVRLTPADAYWAAKRLVDSVDEPVSIRAGHLPADAASHLAAVLRARRRALVEHAFRGVSTIDPAATSGRSLWLRDRAVAAGVSLADDARYDVDLLDADGAALAPRSRSGATDSLFAIAIPDGLAGRVVVRVRVIRAGDPAARACDIHVVADGASLRILGVRH